MRIPGLYHPLFDQLCNLVSPVIPLLDQRFRLSLWFPLNMCEFICQKKKAFRVRSFFLFSDLAASLELPPGDRGLLVSVPGVDTGAEVKLVPLSPTGSVWNCAGTPSKWLCFKEATVLTHCYCSLGIIIDNKTKDSCHSQSNPGFQLMSQMPRYRRWFKRPIFQERY